MTTNGITQADPTNTQINEKQKQETKLLGEMVESIWGLPENEAGIGKKKKRERDRWKGAAMRGAQGEVVGLLGSGGKGDGVGG